jgi:serine/threonine protein kinase
MSQCLNPNCLTFNPDPNKFCQQCGTKLLLTDRYSAIKIIGRGGFGRTFQAIDHNKPSKPVCVIKQFLPDPDSVNTAGALQKAQQLFEHEAISLENLGKHSQIPELFAYFTVDNCQYLVQEFIAGQNLQQELNQQGIFNQEKIKDLLLDLLPVLKFVHDHKVIHRDIKPENIIRKSFTPNPSPTGRGGLVLVDFGAAKQATATALAKTATSIGSVEYAAIEQSQGKPIFASDIYSLGVTCIYLLTNISPFDLFDNHEGEWVWRNYLHNNPVDDHLGAVLDRMIQQYVKPRYQSADHVLADLGVNQRSIQTPLILKLLKCV